MTKVDEYLQRLDELKRMLEQDGEQANKHLSEAYSRLELMKQQLDADSYRLKRHLGETVDQLELIKLEIVSSNKAAAERANVAEVQPHANERLTDESFAAISPSPSTATVKREVEQVFANVPSPEKQREPHSYQPADEHPRQSYAEQRPVDYQPFAKYHSEPASTQEEAEKQKSRSSVEAFIGGNLIGKIGILITLIGIFIGTRYAIEHGMISETMRIVLGYVAGGVLAGLGLKLKSKYLSYSALLLGGGLAVMYFTTFLAYSLYQLIPQVAAFIIMLLITVATVVQALKYNQVIVAHIGLVGAYAIPFFVSTGSGNYLVLFSYMALINAGILAISLKRYWKSLYYVAFILTWLIYLFAWFSIGGRMPEVRMFFALAFFLTFYATFLLYKLIKNDTFILADTMLMLCNAAIFFAVSYALWDDTPFASHQGLAPLTGAFIHLVAFLVAKRFNPTDKSIYYLTSGLALLFLTIAVPMELQARGTALFWSLEALLLCFIAFRKSDRVYLGYAAALAIVAMLGWMYDYALGYTYYMLPIVNSKMLVDVLTLSALGATMYLYRRMPTAAHTIRIDATGTLNIFYGWVTPAFLTVACLLAINTQLNIAYANSSAPYSSSRLAHMLSYCLYVAVLVALNVRFFKSKTFNALLIVANLLAIIMLLTYGMYELANLYDSYAQGEEPLYFMYRYLCLAATAANMYMLNRALAYAQAASRKAIINAAAYLAGLVWASSEYLLWADVMGFSTQSRLGLSIVWGLYAIMLIVMGIRRKSSSLRVGGIVLFGITLAKLFFFDLANADVLTKTVVFTGLGIILLIVAYLYNRYKDTISGAKGSPTLPSDEPSEGSFKETNGEGQAPSPTPKVPYNDYGEEPL